MAKHTYNMVKTTKNEKIGFLDSGIGGLTVFRELIHLMPNESLIYYGDNANCPYGNRPREEILSLTLSMLDFLSEKDIKVCVVACNTISSLIDEYRNRYAFPIISIIESVVSYLSKLNLKDVGVIATEFTIKTGAYTKAIQKSSPKTNVHSVSSKSLAGLVDRGDFESEEIKSEIENLIKNMKTQSPDVKHIILGCTHYGFVQNVFEKAASDITFIDPALEQAKAVQTILTESEKLAKPNEKIYYDIYTSGEKEVYETLLKKLEIQAQYTIYEKVGHLKNR